MTDSSGAGSGEQTPPYMHLRLPERAEEARIGQEPDLPALVGCLSVEEQARLTAGADSWATASVPAIHLHPLRMADGPLGVASPRVDERDVSLLAPSGVALGATWDRELVRRVGELVGDEARRRAVQVILGPNLNLPRSPLSGRAFEMFAEDPFLTGILGASWIAGVQSRGVAAVAKHLVCNDSETQRHSFNAVVDEQTLRELYLLPFEIAVAAGVWGMMTAYNRLNGVHCVEHPELIREIVKGQWGWDGLFMSDWFGTHRTLPSLLAGLDLEMPGPARHFGAAVAEAVRGGQALPSRLEDAATRLLRLAARTGRLATAGSAPERPNLAGQRALLREAAASGFVLLKNERALLPLAPAAGRRIAVLGPNAATPCYQGATFARIALESYVETPLAALQKQFGAACEVVYEPGVLAEYRLPPITNFSIHAAHDGQTRGLTVDYFADESSEDEREPLAREVRNTSTLVWFSEMPGFGPLNRNGRVRASTILTPERTGVHTFYLGGTGAVRLLIDGEEVAARDQKTPAADIMGALLRGDSATVERSLQAGVPVRLDLEMRFIPARAQGLWLGCRPPELPELLERAVAVAASADVAVLFVGETADSGVESADRATTKLPAPQIDLIKRVCAVNPATVVVVNAAHAVDTSWDEQAGAVLYTWFAGQEYGPALAAVLSGELEPGGRLPVTIAADERDYPAFDLTPDHQGDLLYQEQTLVGYRAFEARKLTPKYSFGHGLGYATFAYQAMRVQPVADGLEIAVTVRNTSARAGKEVVQLYVAGPQTAYAELKGFAALKLAAGATGVARMRLDRRTFARWSSVQRNWQPGYGTYSLNICHSSREIVLRETINIDENGLF